MTASNDPNLAVSSTMELSWAPASRVIVLRYLPVQSLNRVDGEFLLGVPGRWVGTGEEPFAMIADAREVHQTDADYRAMVSGFFRQRRRTAVVAILHAKPVIRVAAEMLRIAAGIQLRTFLDETATRAWLSQEGFAS